MSTLDIILLLIIASFILSGFRFGLIVTLGSLLGTVIGAIIAGMYFDEGALILQDLFISNANLANVISFIVIFTVTSRLTGLVFWIIDKMFKIVTIIPFLSSINRLAGACLGLVEGVVVIGIALLFIDKFPFSDTVIPAVEGSQIAQYIMSYTHWLTPLLPEAVKALDSHINIPDGIKNFVHDSLMEEATTTMENATTTMGN